MRIAAMAGIRSSRRRHRRRARGAQESFDISADITELGRTPVAVVSAGAKAILDLPATLEALETAGVPVIGFGTDASPPSTPARAGACAIRLDTAGDVAAMLEAKWRLGLPGGALIANPFPPPEIPAPEIGGAIESALPKRREGGGEGGHALPAGADRGDDGGRSLEANIALVLNNARLGARIAVAAAG